MFGTAQCTLDTITSEGNMRNLYSCSCRLSVNDVYANYLL